MLHVGNADTASEKKGHPMAPITDRLSVEQREALWKWRWLGWRNSTPAFKASIALLGMTLLYVASVAFGVFS